MNKWKQSQGHLCIDAEVARARWATIIAEADAVTVLWLGGIVQAAVEGAQRQLQVPHSSGAGR